METKFLIALARRHRGLDWKTRLDEAVGVADIFGMRRALNYLQPLVGEWESEEVASDELVPERPPVPPRGTAAPPAHVTVVRTGGLLTAKEEEILQLLRRNLSNKQIASALSISDETVKWHVKNLFVKFNAGSRRHVVDRARMLGILKDSY